MGAALPAGVDGDEHLDVAKVEHVAGVLQHDQVRHGEEEEQGARRRVPQLRPARQEALPSHRDVNLSAYFTG